MTDQIARLNAALEGRYTVERELGEGGMATVYLADDLKHERKVALKVLKPELAAVVGAERFLGEIKTTANLQHPNILPLFDSGEADGHLFYVMPYVEGESLADRIDRDKQLPVDEAVRIAIDVGEALQAAHEQRVIHRDIKPANILLSRRRPLVADFGIALAVSAAGGHRLTETGLSVGTPHYMSPEQAAGDHTVGPQADVYALGAVLHEMLTGEPPFVGPTAQAVLAKVLTEEVVDLRTRRRTTPDHVNAVVLKALERLPADRFASASQFAAALGDPSFARPTGLQARTADRTRGWQLATLATSLLSLSLTLALFARRPTQESSVGRFGLPLPPEAEFVDPLGRQAVSVSRDGSVMAYTGTDGADGWLIYVRHRDVLNPIPLPHTVGGFAPTISPEGSQVAYLTGDDGSPMYVIDLDGRNPPRRVGVAHDAGLDWGAGDVLFHQCGTQGLCSTPGLTNEVDSITHTDREAGETRHRWPEVLPGNQGIVFMVLRNEVPELGAALLDGSRAHTRLGIEGTAPKYLPSGYLTWARPDGALMAARFDPDRLEVIGQPMEMPQRVAVAPGGAAFYDVSDDGTLVYGTPGSDRTLDAFWVRRDGTEGAAFNPSWTPRSARLGTPALSATGGRVAISFGFSGASDVWVAGSTGAPFPVTSSPSDKNRNATWIPGTDSIVYMAAPENRNEVRITSGNELGDYRVLWGDEHNLERLDPTVSPDGQWIVMGATEGDLLLMPRDGTQPPQDWLANEGWSESSPAFSPDGRWLAYVSDESGRPEVYARRFPSGDERITISSGGGAEPRWSPAGDEIFYRDPSGYLLSVAVSDSGEPVPETGERLFAIPSGVRPPRSIGSRPVYDVSADGERFLFIRLAQPPSSRAATSEFVWVENWIEEVRALLGG